MRVIHDEGAGVINKESVNALAAIRPHHLQQASINITNNRDQIHDMVDHQFKGKEEVLSSGLLAIRELINGDNDRLLPGPDDKKAEDAEDDDDVIEGEFEEVEDSDTSEEGEPAEDSKDNESLIGKKLASGRVVDEALIKEYTKNKGVVRPKFGDKKPARDEDGNHIYDEDGVPMTVGDMRAHEYDEIAEHLGSKSKYKRKSSGRQHKDSRKVSRGNAVLSAIVKTALLGAGVGLLAVGAGPLALIVAQGLTNVWDSFGPMAAHAGSEDEDVATINEIITQTALYLQNMKTDDLMDNSKTMFKALSSTEVDLYKILLTAFLPHNYGGKPNGRVGKNFFGSSHSSIEKLATIIREKLNENNVKFREEEIYGSEDRCFIFHCTRPRMVVALGMLENHGMYHVVFLEH